MAASLRNLTWALGLPRPPGDPGLQALGLRPLLSLFVFQGNNKADWILGGLGRSYDLYSAYCVLGTVARAS